MLSLVAGLASAAPGEGWGPDDSTQAEDEGTEEPEAAAEEATAPAPAKAPEAKVNKTTPTAEKAQASVEPERDRAPQLKEKSASAHRHDGFYLRLSMGGGSLGARGDRYDPSQQRSDYDFRGNAVSFDAMAGGTPAPGIAVGGAYLASTAARTGYRDQQGSDAGLGFGMLGPFIDVFPDPKAGWHLGGSLGPAVSVSFDDQSTTRSVAAGFGAAAWVGYDFWIADQWSLGATFRVQGARVETPNSRELDKDSPNHDRLDLASASLMLTALYH